MATITTTDGAGIFYKDWGPQGAQPIVLHHGAWRCADDWEVQMLFFVANGYRVVAHDARQTVSCAAKFSFAGAGIRRHCSAGQAARMDRTLNRTPSGCCK